MSSFSSSSKLSRVFYNSIETRKKCFLFLNKKKKRMENYSLISIIKILFARTIVLLRVCVGFVFLSSYRSTVFSACFLTGCFLKLFTVWFVRLRCDLQYANSQIQRLKQGRSSSRRTRELPGSQFSVNDDHFSGFSDSPRPSSPTSTVDLDSGKYKAVHTERHSNVYRIALTPLSPMPK